MQYFYEFLKEKLKLYVNGSLFFEEENKKE